MKRLFNIVFLVLLRACQLPARASVVPEMVDSLLKSYQQASSNNKKERAREIIDLCLDGDMLVEKPTHISNDDPADSLDLLVYYAAVRYYYNHAYFKEGLDYVGRALPLSENNDPKIRATLLCDRCYCLFKQGRMTEAIEAGQKAMELGRHLCNSSRKNCIWLDVLSVFT